MKNDEPARDLLEEAVRSRLFPGVALLVIRSGRPALSLCEGRLTYAPWSPAVTRETVFDLASLTKPLVTTLCIMALMERGVISLEDRLQEFFPDAPEDKAGITIRQLLSHASGLPAHRPFYERLLRQSVYDPKDALTSMVLEEELESVPGEGTLYSDLGFMLLGRIIEILCASSLDRAWQHLVQGPFQVEELFFNPFNSKGRNGCQHLAPTEVCRIRGRVIQGEVNDLNAWAVGGVCGHAGLFGTIRGVADLLEKLLRIYHGHATGSPVSRSTLRVFWTRVNQPAGSTWALGFDTPSPVDSTAGTRFSPRSVGHLGFTGTSFWMDLEEELMVILLSNRTFPYTDERGRVLMKEFRQRCHDLIWEVL